MSFSPAGSIDQGFVAEGDWIVKRTAAGSERLIPVSAVELTGRHMLHNVVAAAAVADVAGVDPPAMVEALKGFHGLEHVMEPVATVRGVRFVNDSKATNVEAARRSIESFDSAVVAIVGGQFKGGDLRELRQPLVARGGSVVAIGEAAPLVHAALDGVVPVTTRGSMADAVRDRRSRCARSATAAWCWRPRARVSTGSATTRSGAGCSRTRCVRWRRSCARAERSVRLQADCYVVSALRRTDGGEGRSHQSARREWGSPLGTPTTPCRRGGCPIPRAYW